MAAAGTICAGETITEDTALQVASKIAFHKTRDRIFVQIPFSGQGKIGLQMFLHYAIQHCIGGASRSINSGSLRWLPVLCRGAALSCHDDSPEASTVYILYRHAVTGAERTIITDLLNHSQIQILR